MMTRAREVGTGAVVITLAALVAGCAGSLEDPDRFKVDAGADAAVAAGGFGQGGGGAGGASTSSTTSGSGGAGGAAAGGASAGGAGGATPDAG